MAFTDIEVLQYQNELNALIELIRPESAVRDQLDYNYEVDAKLSSVVLFELRPSFRDPLRKTAMPIAKAKYNKSREIWTIYWMRANEKWEKYPAESEVSNLNQFFRVVSEDALCCFFG